MISVVVPALNAQATLGKALMGLTRAAIDGLVREVVVVDGGSSDVTVDVADDAGATVVAGSGADRGALLAAGVAAARSGWILTLSQDCLLLPGWEAVANQHVEGGGGKAAWIDLKPGGWLGRLADAPKDGSALLIPASLLKVCGGFGPRRAEAGVARSLGRARRVRLAAPLLTLDGQGGRAVP